MHNRVCVIKNNQSFFFGVALTGFEALLEQLGKGYRKLKQLFVILVNDIKLTQQCQQALQNAEQKVNTRIQKEGKVNVQRVHGEKNGNSQE